MTDDLQVSNSIASFIRFIKRNKNTLFLFRIDSVVSTIFFQKLKNLIIQQKLCSQEFLSTKEWKCTGNESKNSR